MRERFELVYYLALAKIKRAIWLFPFYFVISVFFMFVEGWSEIEALGLFLVLLCATPLILSTRPLFPTRKSKNRRTRKSKRNIKSNDIGDYSDINRDGWVPLDPFDPYNPNKTPDDIVK